MKASKKKLKAHNLSIAERFATTRIIYLLIYSIILYSLQRNLISLFLKNMMFSRI
jgi:hypothetical protein